MGKGSRANSPAQGGFEFRSICDRTFC